MAIFHGHQRGETDAAFVAHFGMCFAFFVIFACDGCIWWVPCRCTEQPKRKVQ